MKETFKNKKNIAILVLAIVLAGSVACNIWFAARRTCFKAPNGNHRIENFQGGQQGQMPQGQPPQGDNQAQPPQGQPPQGQAPNGQEPNAQAPQDGQNSQKNDSDKKGNNDDKKDNDDDDDKDKKTNAQ